MTSEQRTAIHRVLALQLQLWDAANEVERLFAQEITMDTFEELCAGLDTVEDVEKVTDDILIDVFGIAPTSESPC